MIAILDRWRREPNALAAAVEPDGRLPVLDQLIVATQGRHPEVCDLAREVRFNLVDGPLLQAARARQYAEIEGCLSELARNPSGRRTSELISQLVSFPMPMRARLRDAYRAADDVTRARLLEARTRRYYWIRELTGLRCEVFGRHLTYLADYAEDGAPGGAVHLASAYVPLVELPAFAGELGEYLRGLPAAHRVVVDIESWRSEPFTPDEQMAGELAAMLARTRFGRDLDRLDITVTSENGGAERAEEHLRTQHFCYRQDGPGFTEDLLFRNMHPMLAERLELWRLSNFSLQRLASAEDVYLFHAVAHTNPKDERLIALAEVRDLTSARDSGGQVIGYPHMEGMLTQALADIRRALDERPVRQRPLSNRVIVYVRPVWDIPAATWRGLAHRLAPLAAGLGLEKVTVQVHTEDTATGKRRDAILDVENLEDRGVTVRVRPPGQLPIQPLTEYRQKVLRSHRFGAPYPYELIRMLTPPAGAPADFPAGEFTEYDFPDDGDDGRLVPVDRPYGHNRAGIVVGVIRNFTDWYREGCAGWRSWAIPPAGSATSPSRSAGASSPPSTWPSGSECRSSGSRCRPAPDRHGQRHREHGLDRRRAAPPRRVHPGRRRGQRRRHRDQRRCTAVLERRGHHAHAHPGHPGHDTGQRDGAHRQERARLLGRRVRRGQPGHRRVRAGHGPQRPGPVLGAQPRRRVRHRCCVTTATATSPRANASPPSADQRPVRPRRLRSPAQPVAGSDFTTVATSSRRSRTATARSPSTCAR